MKFTSAVTMLASVLMASTTNSVVAVNDTPYKLVFFYTDKPKDNCDCNVDFFRIVDGTYQEYIHEMVFTTSADYKDVDALDSRWNKVASFYENKSKNLEKYRGDYDIWAGRDQYKTNSHYDPADIMYNDPIQNSGPSTPVGADTRGKFAQDYITTHSADNSIVLTDDKSKRRHRALRELKKDDDKKQCGLQIAVGRPTDYDCSIKSTDITGSKSKIDTLKLGSGAAELFYENVDMFLQDHTFAPEECQCKSILDKMTYAVVDIKL